MLRPVVGSCISMSTLTRSLSGSRMYFTRTSESASPSTCMVLRVR